MDSKRRVCLALQALFESIKAQRTNTVTPEYVLEKVLRAAEDPRPEMMIVQADRWRFWHQCTNEELAQLIDEYRTAGYLDEERGAQATLSLRQRST